MKKFFALLFSVALFAVGCEGGFDISGLLKDYLPDPVKSEAILAVDEDDNYIDCTTRNCEDCEYFCPHCGNCVIVDEEED